MDDELRHPQPRPVDRPTGALRQMVATLVLAASLVIVGGVAIVNAAEPSASPSAGASESPADTDTDGQAVPDDTSGADREDCPEKDGPDDAADATDA